MASHIFEHVFVQVQYNDHFCQKYIVILAHPMLEFNTKVQTRSYYKILLQDPTTNCIEVLAYFM